MTNLCLHNLLVDHIIIYQRIIMINFKNKLIFKFIEI